ncbi:tetratricopeptide repeat protein [bacterium]|jgi:DNA-directed RNA polymerase subunit alpha|nr:tetratricopeptide repeat protein [bacterium]
MPEAVPQINLHALLLEREEMDAGVVQQIRTALTEATSQFRSLREAADQLEIRLSSGRGDVDLLKLKIGICSFFLGRMERSADLLAEAKTPLGKFYYGLALNEVGRYEQAIEALDNAAKAGYAKSETELHKVAAERGQKRFDRAHKILESIDQYVRNTAEYLFQRGALLAAEGKDREAVACFEKSIQADSRHSATLFQLAYYNDRNGNDDDAINFYERCLRIPPARVGTLMNLGILYEDHERYDKAAACFRQVLDIFPNHGRARMFYRDSRASVAQFFDEDLEKTQTAYNAVLDIPISEFELSVRSRNCLKKLNIDKLGDLTRISEQQLLNSKNFGETSLTEIKQILGMKGLRLGQTADQSAKPTRHSINADEYSPQERAHFDRPVAELNLSVRARKCMNRLGISTIGDLMSHTGDDLLECKNFGVTSLVEIREKLTGLSLKLRGD